jgi:hypothetical protein
MLGPCSTTTIFPKCSKDLERETVIEAERNPSRAQERYHSTLYYKICQVGPSHLQGIPTGFLLLKNHAYWYSFGKLHCKSSPYRINDI